MADEEVWLARLKCQPWHADLDSKGQASLPVEPWRLSAQVCRVASSLRLILASRCQVGGGQPSPWSILEGQARSRDFRFFDPKCALPPKHAKSRFFSTFSPQNVGTKIRKNAFLPKPKCCFSEKIPEISKNALLRGSSLPPVSLFGKELEQKCSEGYKTSACSRDSAPRSKKASV